LTAIAGHCDLLLMRHEQSDGDHGDLMQIRHNTNRAASLVGQLLAFSRKDLAKVRVDERQLEQVIMNLVVNARDAMPTGGEVTIRTKNQNFQQDFHRDRAVVPFGDYVRIEVADTGQGIPQGELKKIFEPFYLSTVYGIIKQTGGFVFVDSILGQGATFTILLPSFGETLESDAIPGHAMAEKDVNLSGSGVVLLVEDELPVRSFAARALDIRGYSVIEAACGEEALEILSDANLHVDLFVSDVIMPGMDGPTWVKKAREARPDTNVIFVSGYAEDVFQGGEISISNAAFLPKPFSLNELTQAVKTQLTETV